MSIAPSTAITLAFVAGCMFADVRARRIPNLLTGPAIVAGLMLGFLTEGWHGFQASLAGLAIPLVILIGPFALGGIGGGDVKMMAGVGALVGPQMVVRALMVGLILGGVAAVAHLAREKCLKEKLVGIGRMLSNALLSRSVEPLRLSTSGPGAVLLPYSVPLGIGTLGAIALSVAWR